MKEDFNFSQLRIFRNSSMGIIQRERKKKRKKEKEIEH